VGSALVHHLRAGATSLPPARIDSALVHSRRPPRPGHRTRHTIGPVFSSPLFRVAADGRTAITAPLQVAQGRSLLPRRTRQRRSLLECRRQSGAQRNGRIGLVRDEATFRVKAGLAEMLKGGVIMDVVDAEQAQIAEAAGAAAVMALERVPADIRRDGGVARMSDPAMIKSIQTAVTIPVMAKARIGHIAEAQVLEALEVDYIDESEVLTPADEHNHIDKWDFAVPFVCGATNLGEALRRIGEGAAMIRSKGEAGTGDIVEAVRHMRAIRADIRRLGTLDETELPTAAKELGAPLDLVRAVAHEGGLPVVLFCAGGIATPADASLMMQLGAEGLFVGSGIFKSSDPERRARAIVEACTHFADPSRVARASEGLGPAMDSLESRGLGDEQLLAQRGW
jgi:pyridoxal 5'-phosphate synthase pdxS subunit